MKRRRGSGSSFGIRKHWSQGKSKKEVYNDKSRKTTAILRVESPIPLVASAVLHKFTASSSTRPDSHPTIMKLFSTLFGVSMLAAAASASPTSFGDLMTPTAPLKRAAQAITQVTNFGANTSGTKMYIYVPSKLAASPPIIVAIHYCTGTAQGYYNGSPYAQLADQKGFIVIYPESPYSGTCWDVSSRAALTHNGGGDSNSIANMVTYALKQYNGDATKVFVTGSSSGAMMTVCLLGKRDFAVDL